MKQSLALFCCAAIALTLWAQPDPMTSLATRSAIVVLGTISKLNASDEPLLAANKSTAVIKIEKMLAGSELSGDQTGHTATVILARPADMKVGTRAYFFGNPRFIGKSLTFADEGEVPMPAGTAAVPPGLTAGMQARRDAPLRERLALAAMVFRGTVESVKPLEGEVQGKRGLRDEHDPEWQLATVKVVAPMRGTQAGAAVAVLFPGSRDIMWFNTPKLKVGDDMVFLPHRPQEDELRMLRNEGVLRIAEEQKALVVSHPYDVMPPREERRVTTLLKEVQ